MCIRDSFSSGDSGRAIYALAQVAELVDSGQFSLLVGRTFPLGDIAEAQRLGETGDVRGKIVLLEMCIRDRLRPQCVG